MATEGVKGAIADFVCFLRPLSPPQRRNPLLTGKSRYVWKTSNSVAPIWRDNVQLWRKQLGGASEDAQSYWQGHFAACALVERFWHTGRPWNSWGVAPNPTRGAASGLRKG